MAASLKVGAGDTPTALMSGDIQAARTARLLDVVAKLAAELRPASTSTPRVDSRLDHDLGFDSLARVELLARVEREFSVRLGDDFLGRAETVADLLLALNDAKGDASTATAHLRRDAPERIDQAFPDDARTLVDMLLWHAQRHPDRTHVHFLSQGKEASQLSYGELLRTSREIAGGLRRRGVRSGQFVALMLPTGLEFFSAFLGILLVGAVPVPIYPPTRPGQVEDHLRRQAGILRNCDAVALLSFDAARVVAHILAGLVPSLGEVTTPAALKELGAGVTERLDHRGDPGEIAFLQYTSGSTGNPKGVTLDHGNLLANIRAWGRAVQLTPGDVVVSWLPLYHDMGLIGAWLGSLYHACPLVLMSPMDFLARPERWLWAIHEYRGTVTAAPNFAFELCLRHADPQRLQGLDLASWRYAANGAEPVAAETLARFVAAFRAYGFRAESLAPVYGLAECSVGLAVSPPGRGPVIDRVRREAFEAGEAIPASGNDEQGLHLVACGIPLPGHEIRVVDDTGCELPARRIGRIVFRGPSATRGYYRNEEATARLVRNGWLDSGDLGYFAGEDIVITGRSKDIIIRGGRNIYPYEIEEAIGGLPGIRRGCVAAFGVAAPGEGTERLVVVAETREADIASRQNLITRANELAIELLGTPADEVVLAAPHAVLKTSSGKIRRSATREAYLSGELGLGNRAPWRQMLRLGTMGVLRRVSAWARAAYAWTVFTLLVIPALLGLVLPFATWRWGVASTSARLGLWLCGIRREVRGESAVPSGPAIIVANHASYLDVFVVLASMSRPVAFVAKRELSRTTLLAHALRRLGTHFVERFDARKGVEDLRQLSLEAGNGTLLFFPEGTFTAQAGLRAFRLGAFQLAAEKGWPIVPLALNGTRSLMRDGTWVPVRGSVTLEFGSPLQPVGSGWDSALALRDAARAAILRGCGEPDLERRTE